jgi:SAM-dependent methyltransferase
MLGATLQQCGKVRRGHLSARFRKSRRSPRITGHDLIVVASNFVPPPNNEVKKRSTLSALFAPSQTMGVDPKKLVAEGYDRLYEAYANWTEAGHGSLRRRYIDMAFETRSTVPAQALDLGCGTGRHATAYLVERGLEVTGVDISAASVAAARQEVPAAQYLVGDMTALDLPPSSFDLVTAFYSIIHVPRLTGPHLRAARLGGARPLTARNRLTHLAQLATPRSGEAMLWDLARAVCGPIGRSGGVAGPS